METIDPTTQTITELESLAYQQIKVLNQVQTNIRFIEEELAKRAQLQPGGEPAKAAKDKSPNA